MINTPAFLYGESLFVTMRIHDGNILFKDDQVSRLLTWVRDYYLDGKEIDTLEKSRFMSFIDSIALKENEILRLCIYAKKRETIDFEDLSFKDLHFSYIKREISESVSLNLKTYPSPFTLDYPSLKMGSYMPHLYARRVVRAENYDDALFCINQKIIEASTSNIFFLKNDQIMTPSNVIFKGLIREKLIKAFQIKECDIDLKDLTSFDFAFLTNCAKLAHPIKSIDEVRYNCNQKLIDKLNRYLLYKE